MCNQQCCVDNGSRYKYTTASWSGTKTTYHIRYLASNVYLVDRLGQVSSVARIHFLFSLEYFRRRLLSATIGIRVTLVLRDVELNVEKLLPEVMAVEAVAPLEDNPLGRLTSTRRTSFTYNMLSECWRDDFWTLLPEWLLWSTEESLRWELVEFPKDECSESFDSSNSFVRYVVGIEADISPCSEFSSIGDFEVTVIGREMSWGCCGSVEIFEVTNSPSSRSEADAKSTSRS